MAACHWHSWWIWQTDNLWATLIRLWLHTLSFYLLCNFIDMSYSLFESFFGFSFFLCFPYSCFLWPSPSIICSVELASIMVESSHHYWSCDRNSLWWLMCATDLHPLSGAEELSGDVMIVGQCCWRSLRIHVTVVQTTPHVFPMFFRVGSLFSFFLSFFLVC